MNSWIKLHSIKLILIFLFFIFIYCYVILDFFQVTVQIFIKNINDHPPKFDTKLPYVSCVIEGSAANLPIITVVARDHDKIPVPLEYTLVALNETEEPSLRLFKINKINGTITTRKRLDNLKKNVYQMVVSVEEKTTNRPFINYQKVGCIKNNVECFVNFH